MHELNKTRSVYTDCRFEQTDFYMLCIKRAPCACCRALFKVWLCPLERGCQQRNRIMGDGQ